MTTKLNVSPMPVAGQRDLPPVTSSCAGLGPCWKSLSARRRDQNLVGALNKALGTTSSAFVNASLFQLQGAARSPFGAGISETHMNAALAMIVAAAPKDEIEGALAVQMACTHAAAMAVLANLDARLGTERRVAVFGSAAARLLRAYAMQVEVFRRLRNGGQQYVRVEHVHVNDGGQAVIGNVKARCAMVVPPGRNERPQTEPVLRSVSVEAACRPLPRGGGKVQDGQYDNASPREMFAGLTPFERRAVLAA